MSRFNSTTETHARMIKKGYSPVFTTEREYGGFKHDPYGCLDCIGEDAKGHWVGVQACTESDYATHLKDFNKNMLIRFAWIDRGHGFEFWIYPNKAEREEGDTEPRIAVVATAKKKGGK